jgi:inner membrane protein CreD
MKRFSLVLVVWCGCCFAWVVLGMSLVARTGEWSADLKERVHKLWGPPMEQAPPRAAFRARHDETVMTTTRAADGRPVEFPVTRTVEESVPIPIQSSALDVRLDLEHRRKGLLWFSTYAVDFSGRYAFVNAGDQARDIEFSFPLGTGPSTTNVRSPDEAQNAVYDGFAVRDAAGAQRDVVFRGGNAEWSERMAPGARREFTVTYRSRGTATWKYRLTEGTGQVRNFRLAVATNFGRVDFPPGSIAPSRHAREGQGWRGEWSFESLVANAPIGIVLPERLNPGPLAARITFFAPVGLLFFCFVVAMVAHAQGRAIHPMNYFFLGCAFFAFHLLFAYLVDHLAIAPSFAIASATSILLVTTYARLFTGWRFALRVMGGAQLVYLVLFSYTFFWDGFTGLAITIGAIVTLFVMMQYTGKVDWDQPRLQRAA